MRAIGLTVLPAAAAARGIVRSLLAGQPQWLPYYVCYAVFNYAGMLGREP
jgi:hypothetical protein